MMEAIRVKRKNSLNKVAGSLKTKIPTSAVPTAPMPVHTAYAVPIGSDCVAFTSNTMLMQSATRKPMYHQYISRPVVSFAFPKQKAKATSKSPAIIRNTQFIFES